MTPEPADRQYDAPPLGLRERFWEKVDVAGDGECWEWAAATDSGGYGQIKVSGTLELAHRVSWWLASDEWPGGDFVLHDCDNPPCVNPAHLYLGDHEDNMRDAVDRDRTASGEENGGAELTWDDVNAIRTRYPAEDVTQLDLAVEYGIAFQTVSKIINEKKWQDPEYDPPEEHGNAKLTWDDVTAIRTRYPAEDVTQRDLAVEYGIGSSTISQIINGEKWQDPEYTPPGEADPPAGQTDLEAYTDGAGSEPDPDDDEVDG